ncbi:MAG: MBL fold metallo-hydrolase, partial [Synergistaceae bacterium]|nr:MBL fold metallo-hydrolase [Synergistaceae bacterium]
MANMTFIRTDSGEASSPGWIVFDVMMTRETAEAAMALMKKHFGELNIRAVLYSHSHVDHYGGVEGVIKREDVADASLPLK